MYMYVYVCICMYMYVCMGILGGSSRGVYSALSIGLTAHDGQLRLQVPAAIQVQEQPMAEQPAASEHSEPVEEVQFGPHPLDRNEDAIAEAEDAASGRMSGAHPDDNLDRSREVDDPGFSDLLVHIDLTPARRALEEIISQQVFGRWRRGMRGTWKASHGHIHVLRGNVLSEGHPLVTASDFSSETVIGLLPERYATRYMPKHKWAVGSTLHNQIIAHNAKGQRQPTAFPCPNGGFFHRTIFKRYCWRLLHMSVDYMFPKGHGEAVAGVYECLDCGCIFRGFNHQAQQHLPDVVILEMFDFVFTGREMTVSFFACRIKLMRDNGVLFAEIARILNEEKVEAYWRLAHRFVASTVADRQLGIPPASPSRLEWRNAHHGTMQADHWPHVEADSYGILPISAHTVQLIYAAVEADDLEDKMLRIQKVTARVMNEDMAHKAAAKLGVAATDKGMNEYGEVYRYLVLWRKSQADLKEEDAKFAARVVRNEQEGLGPRTQYIGSDNVDNEEARWGGDGEGLMPWLHRSKEVLAAGTAKLIVNPPEGHIVVDNSNMDQLPHYLQSLRRNAVNNRVGFDCEWVDGGVDCIQIATPMQCVLIRACFFTPRCASTPYGEMPQCLRVFLTSGLVKVGIHLCTDAERLCSAWDVQLSPMHDLATDAKKVYPEIKHWGLVSLVKAFIDPSKVVAGKNTSWGQLSDWSMNKPQLSKKQIKYAVTDAIANIVLDILITAQLDNNNPPCMCEPNQPKCIICQVLPKRPHAGTVPDTHDDTDEEAAGDPSSSYKRDIFHALQSVLLPAGVKHTSHGTGASALSMIVLCWDGVCYAAAYARIKKRYPNMPDPAIRLLLLRHRSCHPERVKATCRAPSVLLPMLQKFWDVYARQWCPKAKQLWLDRPKPREQWERFITDCKMGRMHDEDDAYLDLGNGVYKAIRPQTSGVEAFHEREIRILGKHNSRVGLIIGGFVLLALVIRNNVNASVKYRGMRNFGIAVAGFYRYKLIAKIQGLLSSFPTIFPPAGHQVKFAEGDVSTLPDTGELFGPFWRCGLWDALKQGGERTASVLSTVLKRHGESEESITTFRDTDLQLAVATVQPQFSDFLLGQGDKAQWECVEGRCSQVALTLASEVTLRQLQTAVEECLQHQLTPAESKTLVEQYSYDSYADPMNEIISPHFFAEQYYSWLAKSARSDMLLKQI